MAKEAKTAKPASKPRKPRTRKDVPGAVEPGPGHNNPPVPTTDVRTADETRSLFLSHRSKWNEWQAKAKALQSAERDLKAALKDDGFTVKQFQIADALAGNPKQEAKVRTEVKDRLLVARWMGHPLGAQFNLFEGGVASTAFPSAGAPGGPYDAGKMASMSNQPRKPPEELAQEAAQEWMDGYSDHQEELARGFKAPPQPDSADIADAMSDPFNPAGNGSALNPDAPTLDDLRVADEPVSRADFQRRLGEMGKL